ncbi:serine/threonine-protein kinase [Paludibaculum fermentans]|uniref:Protein kinase n=1 Tax=Paludibaculum fermentans TaxID=1473598 RepID=A0A7S7NPU1_PALFE|nr:serine/threonine-protein kinase [Paludibaculum fermentans]QOY87538.1 protein kinase [Paludibaculum fermentans]
MMDASNESRLRRLDALFDQALSLPPERRQEFLSSLDEAVRESLERLLSFDGPSVLGEAIAGLAQIPLPETEPWHGQQVGPYRITREIGRGGMGTVFAAVRDGEFSQTVALKVATRAPYSHDFDERFREERQILARLEHPNIARLLDGGSTNEGLPYFAMELVSGEAIHNYCLNRALPLRERIELFLKVCDAVQYAHENLVVHRDLKPANILVDPSGQPKLLDFGIAKMMDPLLPGVTVTSLLPMTPDYSSPEQIQGRPITTRTDVYLLGLLLFELLCDSRAQTADTTSPAALERTVCERDVPVPSTAAPVSRRGALRGDLDSIVGTATRKPPEQRYASVKELAEDLRRHLDSRPISVRRNHRAYRLGRFLRRQWLPVTAAALVLLTGFAGGLSAWMQARRAERRFNQVRGIARTLMFDVENAIAELPSSVPAQKLVVESALTYLNGLAQEAGNDPQLLLELGAGYRRIGRIQGSYLAPSLGQAELANANFRLALSYLERAAQVPTSPLEVSMELAETHLSLSNAAQRSGHSLEATQHLHAALSAVQSEERRFPNHRELSRELARIYVEMCQDTGPGQPNPEFGRKAVDILEPLYRQAPSDRELQGQLANAYSAYGSTLLNARRAGEALPQYEKYVALGKAVIAGQPNSMSNRRNLMLAYAKVGDAWWGFPGISLGDRAKGLENFRLMLAQAAWMLEADPRSRSVATDYAMALMRLGSALPPQDDEAIRRLRESFLRMETLAGAEKNNQILRRSQMDVCLRLAGVYTSRKQPDSATKELRRAVEIGERATAADPKHVNLQTWLIRAYSALGRDIAARHNRAEAEGLIARCRPHSLLLGEFDKSPTGPAWRPRFQTWVADIYKLLGDAARARVEQKEAVNQWRTLAANRKLPAPLAAEMQKALAATGAAR